jgi:hypothetical protein
MLRSQGQDKNCDLLVQRGDAIRTLCRDVFSRSCIYNKSCETFAGA